MPTTYKARCHGFITKSKTKKAPRNYHRHMYEQSGGLGGSAHLYWNTNPDFVRVNADNAIRIILHKKYNPSVSQFARYKPMLTDLLTYANYNINLDFINDFNKYIYYDVDGTFGIDIRKSQHGPGASWINSAKSRFTIEKRLPPSSHENTTILFLKGPTGEEKVLKVFNNLPVSVNKINEYLELDITHIGPNKTGHKLNFNTQDAFNLYNFNLVDSTIPEAHPESRVYLSCRNNDAINDYIINLVIKHISGLSGNSGILSVNYDNLFITKIRTDAGDVYKYCIIMDKFAGSLDSYFKKNITTLTQREVMSTVADCLAQTEAILNLLKGPDYLFTHTDMKLENLFYKLDSKTGKPVIYIADFDKSSISLHGIRFYNDIRQNPNLHGLGGIMNSVKGLGAYLNIDNYTIDNYNSRKLASDGKRPFHYSFARAISPGIKFEFEQYYMRYGPVAYYTSFDMVSLILSFLYYRIEQKDIAGPRIEQKDIAGPRIEQKDIAGPRIEQKDIAGPTSLIPLFQLDYSVMSSNKALSKILKKYMTQGTLNRLLKIYKVQLTWYNGNFGKLLAPLFGMGKADLESLKFIHNFVKAKPALIKSVYLTYNNKLALSLPIVAIGKQSLDKTVKFIPAISGNMYKEYIAKYPILSSYIKYLKTHKAEFTIEYSGDFIADKLSSSGHTKQKIIVKTNRQLQYDPYSLVYEWDYLSSIDNTTGLDSLFKGTRLDLEPVIMCFNLLN
jgi:hypothetical protein